MKVGFGAFSWMAYTLLCCFFCGNSNKKILVSEILHLYLNVCTFLCPFCCGFVLPVLSLCPSNNIWNS